MGKQKPKISNHYLCKNLAMTQQLEKVVASLKQLNSKEQNSIASLIVEELLWELSLKKSSKLLTSLVDEALKEHKAGKTKKGGC
jgi:hypothetical protein